jgi:hypothetical protein
MNDGAERRADDRRRAAWLVAGLLEFARKVDLGLLVVEVLAVSDVPGRTSWSSSG